jgi:large subunit ribosomal protein L4
MKTKVITLDNKAAGELELAESVFGVAMRKDILHRMVQYQRAKAQTGNHKTKTISEISGTTKKPFKQKGSGNARQGSLRSAQMRGGSTIFGPVVRSHAIDLPKKVRALALKIALSSKQADGSLFILDSTDVKNAKTKDMVAKFTALGWDKPLIIDGAVVNESFAKAARNIKHVDVLPTQGVNVMDILRHKQLVLTKAAVASLEERLK